MMDYKEIITYHKEWVDKDIETTKRTFSMKTDPPHFEFVILFCFSSELMN